MREMSVGEGKETIDVALFRNDLQIACEVSVTTTVDHEMGNARKCLRAGFNFILLITADESRRNQMTRAVEGHFPREDRDGFAAYLPTNHLSSSKSCRHLSHHHLLLNPSARRKCSGLQSEANVCGRAR